MRALILSVVLTLTSSAKVTWLPSTSFNHPSNFRSGKVPCSKQTVIFPETVRGAIRFQSDSFAKGFVLPSTGELLLDGTIYIGENPEDKCEEGNAYVIDSTAASWSYPDVWSSPRFNEATPDAERVPCSDDTVEFPANSGISVILPEETQHVEDIIVNGESFELLKFRDNIESFNENPQFFFNSFGTVGLVVEKNQCRAQTTRGCPCQAVTLKIDCDLKFCPAPTCSDPIKPIGHCCKICGGTVAFDREQSFNYMEFTEFVDKIVSSYKDDNLVYHVGILSPNKVQVVVVEKGDYTGISQLVANDIEAEMSRKWYVGAVATSLSGKPLSMAGSGVKIAVTVFFIVALLFGGVYAYYYKIPTPTIHLPSLPSFGRGSTAGLLSRYDRRTDSVVSLTRRDSTVTVASGVGVGTVGTAFRNPLYDSTRGRVNVTDSGVDDETM